MAVNNYIANPIIFRKQNDIVRVVDEYMSSRPIELVCKSKLVVASDLMRGMGINDSSTFNSIASSLKIKPITLYVRHYNHNGHPYKSACITFDDAEKLVRCKCEDESFKKWFIESVLGRTYETQSKNEPKCQAGSADSTIPVYEPVAINSSSTSNGNYIQTIDRMIVELVMLKTQLSAC